MYKKENKYTQSYAPPFAFDRNGNHFVKTEAEGEKYYDDLHEYLMKGLENGKSFLRSQRAFRKAENSMSVLMGDKVHPALGLSTLQINKSRRQMRETIANQSDIRQSWEVRTTKSNEPLYQNQVNKFNGLAKHWWSNLFVDRIVKAVQQLAAGHGTGYLYLWPDKNILTGEIDIIPSFLDYKSVLVSHIPEDGDLYKAYRVDIKVEMPLPLAHAKYPDHLELISSDTPVPARLARNWEKTQKIYKGLIDWMSKKKKRTDDENPFPSCNIFHTFIMDNSINETGETICMGTPGSHWYYEVPSYFNKEGNINQIGTNVFKTNESGQREEIKRYVSREDCKIYPFRRYIISCSRGVIYDGCPQWGVGIPPVVQYYYDKIAGEFLAFPINMDAMPIEFAVNDMLQALNDQVVGKVNPPIGIDEAAPPDVISKITQLGARGLIGKVFKWNTIRLQKAIIQLIPAEFYNADSKAFEFVKFLLGMSDYVSGTQDYQQELALKQMPAADSQEALLQKLGVLTTDQTREQERSFMYLGVLWLSYAPQVYTLERRLQILGTDGLTSEEMDFKPSDIAPFKIENDSRPSWIIRREHMRNFSIYVAPNSIQERQSVQKKLSLLQLQKMGNTGVTDKAIYNAIIGDDKFAENVELYFEEQKKKAIMAAEINVSVQQIMQAANPQPSTGQGSPLLEQLMQTLSSQQSQGRPNEFTAPPELREITREGVPDTTVTSS